MSFPRTLFLVVLALATFSLWSSVASVAHAAKSKMNFEQAVAQMKRSATILKKHQKLRKDVALMESRIVQARRTYLDLKAACSSRNNCRKKDAIRLNQSLVKQRTGIQSRWRNMESVMDEAIDQAKEEYEAAKEKFKLSIRILIEHMERQTQVVRKITS